MSSVDVRIRIGKAGDEAAILALMVAAFRNAVHSDHNQHPVVNALRDAGELALSLVAEIDGEVVGRRCLAAHPAALRA